MFGWPRYRCKIFKSYGRFKKRHLHTENPSTKLGRRNSQSLTVNSPKIEFKNVGFAYALENPVFTDLNLTIQPGEKVGLVGYSGSGNRHWLIFF